MKRAWIAGLAVVCLGLAVDAHAQTGTARGTVVDQNGEPVAKAAVLIEGLGGLPNKYEVTTDEEGEFGQIGMRPGKYKFTVTAEGYRTTFVESSIGLGDPTKLPDIALQSADSPSPERVQVIALFEEATGLARAGKLDEAEAKLRAALDVSGDFPEAYYNLGYIHIQREEWTEAETALKKALDLRPDYADAKMSLSSVYQQTGRADEAQAMISEAAESGGSARAFYNLGLVKFDAGDAAGATEAFKKAEELDPENAEVQYYLGTLALQRGQTEESIRLLEKYLGMSPKNEQNVATAKGLLQAIKP